MARAILLLLSEGQTLEDILRQRPDVTRDDIRAAAAAALQLAERGESRQDRIDRVRKLHPHAFEPWTEIEDKLLVDAWRDGARIPALAKTFGRPPGAIRTRLQKLGHDPRRSAVRDVAPPAPRRETFEWAGGP